MTEDTAELLQRELVDAEREGAHQAGPRIPHISRITVWGQDVRVAVWGGDAGGTPLLIFNGIGARLELLAPFVRTLSPDRTVIAFDVPGTGESPAPRVPYRLWMLASLTARILDTLGHHRVSVMGVSWGGTIAQQFALQHPRRCEKLILAATTPGALMIPGDLRALRHMASPRRYSDRAYMKEIVGTVYGGVARTSPELFAEFETLLSPASRMGYLFQQMALMGWTSLPFLPLIRQPTLVLAGDDDPLVPVLNAQIMARLIPRSRLVVFDDGHLFLISKAAECAAHVDSFLHEG